MDAADLHSITFPAGAVLPGAFALVDGAVAELAVRADGTITAEIRIPARQQQSAPDAYQEASNEIRYLTGD